VIVRYRVECLTCEKPYTLRIGLGHNQEQCHEITCENCNENFIVAVDVDFNEVTFKCRCVENCKPTNEEGLVINIDPYNPVPANLSHEDFVFPWMHHVRSNFKLEELLPKVERSNRPGNGPVMVDLFKMLGGQHLILDEWKLIKRGWSLTSNGKLDLAENQFKEYKHIPFDGKPELDDILFNFSLGFISPNKYELFRKSAELYSSILKSYPSETSRFRDFYKNNLRKENLEKYFDIYSQYFRNYSEYAQTLLYIKNGVQLPKNSDASSNSFRETKLFYGNAFEAITSGFTVLACLNNVRNGRPYEQFEQMDLKKFLTTNKAGRANPFQNVPEFYAFAYCIDSVLRNSSHHGAIKINSKNIISYRSGGTGAEHKIKYSEYITKCNEIMLGIAALVSLEILIAF